MKTNNEIRECLMNGQNLEDWHKKKVKENNRSWFWLVVLILTIFVGHHIIFRNKFSEFENYATKMEYKDSIIFLREKQIDTLQQAVDSAVYFHEIINGNTTKKGIRHRILQPN